MAAQQACEYVQHLPDWQVVICRECRYAVWPDQIQGHFQGPKHQMSQKQAHAIQAEVGEWPGVVGYRGELNIPQCIDQPIPELPLYQDGLQCQIMPDQCQYICRNIKAMREHWRKGHNWSVQRKTGPAAASEKTAIQERFQSAARSVHCQRLFVQGQHSQYFEVRQPERAGSEQVQSRTKVQAWEIAWEMAKEYHDRIRTESEETVRKGEPTEVNPWLQRTGWIPYLEGCQRKDLLESIREPVVDDPDDTKNEPIERAIWEAMRDVASISQETVRRSGVMLRLEAIRTEKHQTRYQPLQPYQDASAIDDRCRPWQQILMFFARTQRRHDWESPEYRFNRRQHAAFQRLIHIAEEAATEEEAEEDIDDEEEEEPDSEDEHNIMPDTHTRPKTTQPPPLTRIQSACLAFCIELLNQRIHNREYDMALVCAAAVLGVQPIRQGFRDPESYPPVLSAMIKVAHFLVVQQAEELSSANDEGEYSPCGSPCRFDSGYESGESEGSRFNPSSAQRPRSGSPRDSPTPTSSFEWVGEMMDRFMVRGTGSPVQWLLDLRTYGMKIHYNTTAIGHVNWRDGSTLEYKDIRFNMDQFRGMIHQLLASTRTTLQEDLMFANRQEMPSIPWENMYDDPTNGQIGWSFLQDTRSRWPVDGQEWLFHRIQQHPEARDRFVRRDHAHGIHREHMRDWMRQVAHFRGQLLVLMHMTGGQPARGTEILSIRHRNTTAGGHRSIFIEDGRVVFVTKYHKGYQMSGDVKIIHRYLPREVGELVVWYLWLVLPFVQRIEAMVWQQTAVSDFMWPADVDGRKWTTDRIKEHMQDASNAAMGAPIHVAAYREIAIAISRRWIRSSTAFQRDEGDENDEWQKENAAASYADEQATHSPHIAGMIYARESTEMAGATADRRQQFRAVSSDWHRFLAFESACHTDGKTDLKRKRCPFEDDAQDECVARRVRLRRMDASAELSRMMRKEVSFRSAQGQAMQAIQDGESPIVAVMPTGAGKSVLFMLPAWVEPGGVSIVVVPLKALRKDMMHRCQQLNIQCAVWDGRRQPDGASIVLVTPEKAVEPEFGTYVSRIRQTRQLDRIVVDECHVILNDQVDFRKCLQQLGKTAHAETQMLLLTATLPPEDEPELWKRMHWFREEVTLIRAPTVRSNIAYSVIDGRPRRAEQDMQLEEMVEAVLTDSSQPEGKVVVMCESIPTVKRIVEAGLFPCEPFHARLDEDVKEDTLNEFRNGNVRVIVATGAFGMGIDIPDIRLIVHVDQPRNMRDYGQASGRAGRDGLASRAVIIRGGLTFQDRLVQQYMDPQRQECRRVDIDRYLDGSEREGCREGEERCDICQRERDNECIDVTPFPTQAPVEGRAVIRAGCSPSTQAPVEAKVQWRPTSRARRPSPMPLSSPPVSSPSIQRSEARAQAFGRPGSQARPPSPPASSPSGQAPVEVREPVFRKPIPKQSTTQAPEERKIHVRKGQFVPARNPGRPIPPEPSTPFRRPTFSTPAKGDRAAASLVTPESVQPIPSPTYRAIAVQDQQRQTPNARRLERVREAYVMQQDIRKRLTQWKGRCVRCQHRGHDSHHNNHQCPFVDPAVEGERKHVQDRITYPRYSCCFGCGVPQTICERWNAEGTARRWGEECQFGGVMIAVVVNIKHVYPTLWRQWVRRVYPQTEVAEVETMDQTLGQRYDEWGFPSHRLTEAFMWLTGRIERRGVM